MYLNVVPRAVALCLVVTSCLPVTAAAQDWDELPLLPGGEVFALAADTVGSVYAMFSDASLDRGTSLVAMSTAGQVTSLLPVPTTVGSFFEPPDLVASPHGTLAFQSYPSSQYVEWLLPGSVAWERWRSQNSIRSFALVGDSLLFVLDQQDELWSIDLQASRPTSIGTFRGARDLVSGVDQRLYLLSETAISVTGDGGSTWSEVTSVPVLSSVRYFGQAASCSFLFSDHYVSADNEYRGLIRWCPGESGWTDLGLTPVEFNAEIYALEVGSEGEIWIAYQYNTWRGRFYHLQMFDSDSGDWIEAFALGSRDVVVTPEGVIAGGSSGLFLRSDDMWGRLEVGTDAPAPGESVALSGDGAVMMVGESGTIYVSHDSGATWSRFMDGLNPNWRRYYPKVRSGPEGSVVLYHNQGLFTTDGLSPWSAYGMQATDLGVSWPDQVLGRGRWLSAQNRSLWEVDLSRQLTRALFTSDEMDIKSFWASRGGDSLIVAVRGDGGDDFVRSDDGGQSWSTIADPYLAARSVSGDLCGVGSYIAFQEGNSSVFSSNDAGLSWTSEQRAGALLCDSGFVFLATSDSLYQRLGTGWSGVTTLPPGGQWSIRVGPSGYVFLLGLTYGERRVFRSTFQLEMTAAIEVPAERQKRSLTLFPNPAIHEVNLEFKHATTGGCRVDLWDALGRVVQTRSLRCIAGQNRLPLDVSGLPPGIYALRVTSSDQVQASGLLVKSAR